MMFFLMFVDCVALLKDLSQVHCCAGVETPTIKKCSFAPNPEPSRTYDLEQMVPLWHLFKLLTKMLLQFHLLYRV